MHQVIDPRADPEYERYLDVLPTDEYVVVPNVPLLDTHQTTDPKTGKRIDVDEEMLEEVTENCNRKMEETGDAVPFVIGHTKDGDVDESKQPEIIGYYVKYRMGQLLNTDRQAIHGDLFLPKKNIPIARKFPRRSVEFWLGRRDLDPVSALGASTPERSLGLLRLGRIDATPTERPLKFSRADNGELVYRYSIPVPISLPISPDESSLVSKVKKYEADDKDDEKTPADDKKAAEKDAVASETKTSKSVEGKLDQLLQMFEAFMSMLTEGGDEQQDEETEDQDDKDGSKDKGDDEETEDDPKGKQQDLLGPVDPESRRFHESGPVKFEYPSATNTSVPSFNKESKTKMSRDTDEVLKYKKEVDSLRAEQAKDKAVINDLVKKYKRKEAESLMTTLEAEGLVFGDKDLREKELNLMANLSDESLKEYVTRARKLYQRKTPDATALNDVLQYSRTPNTDSPLKNPAEVAKAVNEAVAKGLTFDEYLKQTAGK